MKNDRITDSWKKTFLESDLPMVIQNLGEIGFDSLLDNGVLKDVPILNTVLSLGKTVGNVRDYLFAKKVLKFLECLSSLSETERDALVSKLDDDKKFRNYAGEQLIELLARIDSEQKAILAANALKLYARGTIDSLQLQRINYAIERLLLCDIDILASSFSTGEEKFRDSDPATSNFINAGLVYVSSRYGGGIFPNETARLFLQVVEEGASINAL